MGNLPVPYDDPPIPTVPGDVEELISPLTERQQIYLRALYQWASRAKASEVSGVPVNTHVSWRRRHPAYRDAADAIKLCGDVHWEGIAEGVVVEGALKRKWTRNSKGEMELQEERRDQDTTTLGRILGGRMPEKYGQSDKGSGPVTVVLVDVVEGRRFHGEGGRDVAGSGGAEGHPKEVLIEGEYTVEEDND